MGKGKNGCGVPIGEALATPGAAQAELEKQGNPARSPRRGKRLSKEERSKRREEINRQVEELDRHIQEAIDNPQQLEQWLKDMSKGDLWRYSYGNLCLARMQAKARGVELTRLAGFRRWEALGYKIRKGEKGFKIIAPKSYTRKDPKTGEPLTDKDGNPLRGHYFGTVSVFDISQADSALDQQGKPLGVDFETPGRPEQAVEELTEVARGQGIEVLVGGASSSHPDSDKINAALLANPQAEGFFMEIDGKPVIAVRAGLSADQEARVLAHELGHALMHSSRSGYKDHDDRIRKEVEAESAAYVIAGHYGLADQGQAFYVARWVSGLDDSLREQLSELSGTRLERELAERKRWAVRDALANIQGAVRLVLDRAYDLRGQQ